MSAFSFIKYRDCPWCGVQSVAMDNVWSQSSLPSADQGSRAWAAFACPRCAGVSLVELDIVSSGGNDIGRNREIASNMDVAEIQSIPSTEYQRYHVDHLPKDVASFLSRSIRVLAAGVPDGAAAQLRKTLEAATAHRGIREATLVGSIEKLIEARMLTRDFGKAARYIHKLGNITGHYTDEPVSQQEAEQALRFIVEVLRNLFEVPGALEEIKTRPKSTDNSAAGKP